MTQQQVADLFAKDVTQEAVHYWEAGKKQPGPGRLKTLAKAFDIEVYRLYDRDTQELFQGVMEHIEDLFVDPESVAEYNIEIMRASRELLRWQQFFETGKFEDVDVEAPTDSERRRNAEIDETLDLMTEGKKL